MKWLNGNKTNLGMVVGGICGILWTMGVINDQIASTAAMAITAWTGVAVRSAYSKGK
jgi:uncharacterized membrane protein YoaK (UPF0700 family)